MNLLVSRLPIAPALIVVVVGFGCSTPDREPATELATTTAPSPAPVLATATALSPGPDPTAARVTRGGGPLWSFHVSASTTVAVLFSETSFDGRALEAAGIDPAKLRPSDKPSDQERAALQSVVGRAVEGDCRFTPPSLYVCDLVDKATGRIVGESTRAGGGWHVEADYVLGRGFYADARNVLDHDVGDPAYRRRIELLYVDGTKYKGKAPDRWQRGDPLFAFFASPDFVWEIFKDGYGAVSDLGRWFDRVSRLPDERFDATVTAHRYRAEQDNLYGPMKFDLWIDAGTGYPLKMTREYSGPHGTDRSTYVFSNFNEVELPEAPASAGSSIRPRGRSFAEAAEPPAPL